MDVKVKPAVSFAAIDGNEAAAHIAYRLNEVIAIYPITPASPMGELCDQWAAEGRPNLWGTAPSVIEMQSEGGAAGAVHGALQTGALTTTFTASQGLLLMIPNMYKIAGELTPTVFHIAARTVATSALSIFGDHSDVMAARQTGFALLASASVQEVMDFAAIAQAASLVGRVPVLHFFDGFRTSHEISKVEIVPDEVLRTLVNDKLVHAHRSRALTPERPVLRGSAMNPDVAFQAREAANPYYERFPEVVQFEMDRFGELTGRRYRLFDYEGHPEAERVIVIMGSGAETAAETALALAARGERVGVVKVRLFRPFSVPDFTEVLPPAVQAIAVLDRTKEPGAAGEPLLQEVVTGLVEARQQGVARFDGLPRVIGGRYGLSSKEFTPGMVKAVFDELRKETPKSRFTVGITDDVTGTSLEYERSFRILGDDVYEAVFFGLGSDGTVSANKNSIKIIGEETPNHVQGYFVYDSKKAGSVTVSHLRFGPRPIRAPYLIDQADFVGCHQFRFLERIDVLSVAAPGATLLLNSPYPPDQVWDRIPRQVQEEIIRKRLELYTIDAYRIAREVGLGERINTIMQACFFRISGILPLETAVARIKELIRKTYGKAGEEVVRRNHEAVDRALEELHRVEVPGEATGLVELPVLIPPHAPEFVREVTAVLIAGKGDELPVSKLPCDGTFPTGTARWERRNIALEIPVWDPEVCIQCGKCVLACPHAAIRHKVYEEKELVNPPPGFKWCDARGKEFEGLKYTLQVAPEDCTGCTLCVHVCPARNKRETRLKAINMHPQPPLRETERANFEYFLELPEYDRRKLKIDTVRGSQFLEPLFEASGACAGCGETPYVKLLSQLFGDRLLVANATGCSSIYGGNLPTTPWTANREGRGPAWSNSLFEDNAEFGLGFRLSLDKQREYAAELLERLRGRIGSELVDAILTAPDHDEADIYEQRERIAELKRRLEGDENPDARNLLAVADALVRKTVWIVGGDGWAYDIGYGGLDHVLASGKDVNILVLDTEVYSNTGGQMSKATPLAAVAKFAAGGKTTPKKDLGLIAMTYGDVYVASVAFGANDGHTVRALVEADRHRGPSLVIAYSHCIAHGIHMGSATDQHKLAVEGGEWLLYRYNPALAREGKCPLHLDSKPPSRKAFDEYLYRQTRFRILSRSRPDTARRLQERAWEYAWKRWRLYSSLAALEQGGQAATRGGSAS